MDSKNKTIKIFNNFIFISPHIYILLLIFKLIVVIFNAPGAQGGTGGW